MEIALLCQIYYTLIKKIVKLLSKIYLSFGEYILFVSIADEGEREVKNSRKCKQKE